MFVLPRYSGFNDITRFTRTHTRSNHHAFLIPDKSFGEVFLIQINFFIVQGNVGFQDVVFSIYLLAFVFHLHSLGFVGTRFLTEVVSHKINTFHPGFLLNDKLVRSINETI